jgi:hypothetical protein
MIGPHHRLSFRFSNSMLLAAAVGALLWFVAPASAQIVPVSLAGSTSCDGWGDMTRRGFPGYPEYPGSVAWPQPMGSNLGSGDAELQRLAGGTTTGGPFPAEESLYFGSFRQIPNDLGGTLRVADGTPVSGVKTLVLQIQIGEAEGYDFVSPGGSPALKVNGETVGRASLPPVLIDRFQSGTYPSPETELDEPVFVNTWGFQWDVSSLGPISSLGIDFSAVTHAQIYEVRLDQSDVAASGVVFVPRFLALAGMGTPLYDGSSTSVTHSFTGPPASTLIVEYSEYAGQSAWTPSAPVETDSGTFNVTFTAPGDRRAAWSRNMFFRAKYPSDP